MDIKQHFEANGHDAFLHGNLFRVILDNRNYVKSVVTLDVRYKLAPGDVFTVNTAKYKVVKVLAHNPTIGVTKYEIKLLY